MNTIQLAPSPEILAAFGLPGVTPRLLADGSGTSWSITSAILKPVDDALESQWISELFSGLTEDGFRIPRPIAATDGSFIVEGWCAWHFIPGRHENDGDWQSMLAAGLAFHKAISGIDPPGFLATERHHWAAADRIAWGEERAGERWELAQAIAGQLALVDAADRQLPKQLIHGDLAGNLLYEEGLDPGVIDFSPYWRPLAYAMAIAVADAIAWQAAPPSLLALSRVHGVTDSLLRRAIVFRLAAVAASPAQGETDQQAELAAYGRLSDMLDRPHPLQ